MKKGVITGTDIRFHGFLGAGRPEADLAEGDAVEILETWHRIRFGAQEGFVKAEAVRQVAEAESAKDLSVSYSAAHSPGAVIDIQVFEGSAIQSDKPIECDLDFHPALVRLDKYAAEFGVYIFVTQSLRRKDRQPHGAIVPPAKRSNHLVGHAIDMNLFMGNRNPWFNSKKLKRANLRNLPAEVRNFIEMVRSDEVLRWGGDFVIEDPVHIDDNLYSRTPDIWMKKYEAL